LMSSLISMDAEAARRRDRRRSIRPAMMGRVSMDADKTNCPLDVEPYFDGCRGGEEEGPEAYYRYVEDHSDEGNAGRRERRLDIMGGRFCWG